MKAIRAAGALSLALLLSLAPGQLFAEELKVNDTAPEFELPGTDGKTYRLSDLTKDSIVVLAWYPKAFTGG